MGELNEIDDLFKNNFKNVEMEHSTNVWSTIENGLNKKENENNKFIIFKLRSLLGGISLIMVLGVISYFLFFNQQNRPQRFMSVAKNYEKNFLLKELQEKTIKSTRRIEINTQLAEVTTEYRQVKKQERNYRTINKDSATVSNQLSKSRILSSSRANEKDKIILVNKYVSRLLQQNYQIEQKDITTLRNVDSARNENAEYSEFPHNSNNIDNPIKTDSIKTDLVNENVNQPSLLENNQPNRNQDLSLQFEPLKSKYYLMAFYTPEYFMNSSQFGKGKNSQNESPENNFAKDEIPAFSGIMGLLVGYDFSKHWGVKLGLNYSYMEQLINPRTIHAELGNDGLAYYQFNTSFGNAIIPRTDNSAPNVGDSLDVSTSSDLTMRLFNVPFLLKYQFEHKKMFYYCQIGLSANYLAREILTVEVKNDNDSEIETITRLNGINNWHLGGQFAFGFGYNFNSSFSMILQPGIRAAFTPMNGNAAVISKPVNFGLTVGIIYHF